MSTRHFVSLLLLVVLITSPLRARAQGAPDNRTILVLVKDMPGAPTPAQIVNYTNTWPRAAQRWRPQVFLRVFIDNGQAARRAAHV